MAPKLLILFFSTGFHWRIFLLSRANRLYSIFLHWLEEPGVPRVPFVFNPEYWLWFVCPLRTQPKNWSFLLSISADGGGSPTSVLGSQPIIWLLSPSPSGVQRPEVTKYQHLLISPLWPTFSLNGHFFWRVSTVHSNGRIVLILPLSSPRDITWHYKTQPNNQSLGKMKVHFVVRLIHGRTYQTNWRSTYLIFSMSWMLLLEGILNKSNIDKKVMYFFPK